MQHLLDFIQQHSVDSEIYLLAGTRTGDPELLWERRNAPQHWQLRPYGSEGPAALVHYREVLSLLAARNVDMERVERELQIVCAAQIAFADSVLSAARELLGHHTVQRAVHDHRTFIDELRASVERLTGAQSAQPSMVVVSGGRARTEARAGHLSVVR